GDMLYYAETFTGRVFQRRITAPGQLAEANPLDPTVLLVGLPGYQLLDSLGVDAEGNVCVATLGANPGITVISPAGEARLEPIGPEYWDPLTTNICWGGDDLRTAYMTVS